MMTSRFALSLSRALPNCARSGKNTLDTICTSLRQYSTLRGLQLAHTRCPVTVPLSRGYIRTLKESAESQNSCRTFSLSVSPVQSMELLPLSPAVCRHYCQKLSPAVLPFMTARTNTHSLSHSTFPQLPLLLQIRHFSSNSRGSGGPNTSTIRYMIATAIVVLGLSYAAVPLYRLFCQASGYGGTVTQVVAGEKVKSMQPVRERSIIIRFNADTSAGMRWQFKPQQKEITVVPGETALAFYTARNPTDKPVTGISSYNVVPFDAGQYFNKIQCFCFEEQILNPNEQVDMPVFFYIDPEFSDDPAMARVTTITLSYTFFEAKEGESIYIPVPQKHKL